MQHLDRRLDRMVHYDGSSPMSKGSVDALVRQVAAEEGKHGIRVNAVAIGYFLLPST